MRSPAASSPRSNPPAPVSKDSAFIDNQSSKHEFPSISVFYKVESGEVFHTCSGYCRWVGLLVGAYN